MMHLKGTISWEGLCYSCGYRVAMVATDVPKVSPKETKMFFKTLSLCVPFRFRYLYL